MRSRGIRNSINKSIVYKSAGSDAPSKSNMEELISLFFELCNKERTKNADAEDSKNSLRDFNSRTEDYWTKLPTKTPSDKLVLRKPMLTVKREQDVLNFEDQGECEIVSNGRKMNHLFQKENLRMIRYSLVPGYRQKRNATIESEGNEIEVFVGPRRPSRSMRVRKKTKPSRGGKVICIEQDELELVDKSDRYYAMQTYCGHCQIYGRNIYQIMCWGMYFRYFACLVIQMLIFVIL